MATLLVTPYSDVLQIPLPVLLETADTFEVLHILSHRTSPKYHQYLVQWRSTDFLYNTWEPHSSLSSCSHVVRHYEERIDPSSDFASKLNKMLLGCVDHINIIIL